LRWQLNDWEERVRNESACEEKILCVIIIVLKSVARIRLVKTESPNVCATENCKVQISDSAVLLVVTS
jgi:hypothetical protein